MKSSDTFVYRCLIVLIVCKPCAIAEPGASAESSSRNPKYAIAECAVVQETQTPNPNNWRYVPVVYQGEGERRTASLSTDASKIIEQQTADQQRQQTDVPDLNQGQLIEREITNRQEHSYRVRLQTDQYLHVEVEQLGINVAVALIDPNGAQVLNVDWWWREGTESLWALGESTGDYTIKIKASEQPIETGKYRIKIEKIGEWRQASAADRDLITAHKAHAEGERLLAEGTAESLTLAAEKFQAALPLWRRLKDQNGEAQTLQALGAIQDNSGNLKQAIGPTSQALELFRGSNNRRGEVVSLSTLGTLYNFSGETQKAFETYSKAVPLARAIKDYVTEADLLSGLGLVLHTLGQTEKALETLNESASLSRARGMIGGQAVAHNNIGLIYISQGRMRDAVEHYSQTLSLLQSSNDKLGRATTLNNLGNAYTRMGEFQKALEFLVQGLELARSTGDRRREAYNLTSIGFLNIRLGDYSTALQFYNQSLTLSRSIGARDPEHTALSNLGTIYNSTGEVEKARDYFNQALALAVQLKLRSGEASALAGLASISDHFGDREKALDYYDKALRIRKEINDQYGESYVLVGLGVVYAQLENRQMALEYFNQALTLGRNIGDSLVEAATLYQMARIEGGRNDITKARSQIETALNLIESTRTKIGLTDVRAKYFASRQDFYDFYIELLMQSYKSEKDPRYLADALRANERRRARSLLDNLGEARADIRAGVSPELLQRERNLQQDLNAKTDQQVRLLSRKHNPDQAEGLTKEIESLNTDYEQVLAEIRKTSPKYAAMTQPSPLDLKQIQAEVLDPDTLLLEYALGQERSYLWIVSSTSIAAQELPKRTDIESVARRVYESLTARNRHVNFETPEERRARVAKADAEYNVAASALSRMILAPASALMSKKRLLIVSDGALQYLPFSALPAPDAPRQNSNRTDSVPLIAMHEVVTVPSASTLAVLRKEIAGRKPASKMIAVLADPVFGKDDERLRSVNPISKTGEQSSKEAEAHRPPAIENALTRSVRELTGDSPQVYFPRLPSTRTEAEAIVKLVPENQAQKALDFAANKNWLTDPELSNYRFVHLATHTILNSTTPALSGILLSLFDASGAEREGFLAAQEIYNLKLPVDLVVLSSCKTGLGKEIKGEGIIGITRGFMYAGAARVLVSLWDVDDESTAEIMKNLYQGMLDKQRLSPAAALRSSQVLMWKSKRWHAPYFWAAFVLQGEYK